MELNLPDVVAEVTAAFERREKDEERGENREKISIFIFRFLSCSVANSQTHHLQRGLCR